MHLVAFICSNCSFLISSACSSTACTPRRLTERRLRTGRSVFPSASCWGQRSSPLVSPSLGHLPRLHGHRTHTHTHSYVGSLWTTHVQQEFLHYSWFSFTFLVCDSRVQSLNEALSWRRSLWRCQPPELQHMEQNVINMALIRGLAIPVVRNCNLSFSFLLRIQLWQKNNWSS